MKYFLLSIPVLIYLSASLWANFDLFPKDFMQYWWFDDVGHIVVFGSLTLVACIIAARRQTPIVFAIIPVSLLAIVDEFSQLILTHRTFSYQDLVMSLIGVGLACITYLTINAFLKRK